MNRSQPPYKPLIWVTAIVLVFVAYFFIGHLENHFEQKKSYKPEVKNGVVVLKSFQEVAPAPQVKYYALARRPAEAAATINIPTDRNAPSRVLNKPDDKKVSKVKINGLNLYWQKQKYAVKEKDTSARTRQTASGFKIVNAASPFQPLGTIEDGKFHVLTDVNGLRNRIMTGAVIVEFKTKKESSFYQDWANGLQLNLNYSAPNIKLAILQVPAGKNIFEIQKNLAADPQIKSVKIELLSPGARAQ